MYLRVLVEFSPSLLGSQRRTSCENALDPRHGRVVELIKDPRDRRAFKRLSHLLRELWFHEDKVVY